MGRRENEGIDLLLLEPDFWRFTGIEHFAQCSGELHVVGERHFEKILTAKTAPGTLSPTLTMLADRLIIDYGISLIPHLRDLFSRTHVLVFGDDDRLERTAEVLAVGASGYFLMSTDESYLQRAARLICDGRIWAPREAVAMFARRSKSDGNGAAEQSTPDGVDEKNLIHLLYQGLSNKEIAQRYGFAEVTIKAKMGRLYRKYGVRTRVQLLAAAMRRGIVAIDVEETPAGELARR